MAPETSLKVVQAVVKGLPAKIPAGPFQPTWESLERHKTAVPALSPVSCTGFTKGLHRHPSTDLFRFLFALLSRAAECGGFLFSLFLLGGVYTNSHIPSNFP
jgi:hypothetical protein